MNFDVFNGDADGICALLQIHFDKPEHIEHQLISGVKRDIQLLKKLPKDLSKGEPPGKITVLDISLDKNKTEVEYFLSQGFEVFYADHHFAGDFIVQAQKQYPKFEAHIDTQPNTCTSLIISQLLHHKYYLWAIVGAYGDNMLHNAIQLCEQFNIDEEQRIQLKKLGAYINYNGYGGKIDDLHFDPIDLFNLLKKHENPINFILDESSGFSLLEKGYEEDMLHVNHIKPFKQTDDSALFILEDATWSRRVNGVWGNELANEYPNRAHAILTHKDSEYFSVSIRAPLNNRVGADELCGQFPSGGGRKAAAGINQLPKSELEFFISLFEKQFENPPIKLLTSEEK